jgi:hypothetical protein
MVIKIMDLIKIAIEVEDIEEDDKVINSIII